MELLVLYLLAFFYTPPQQPKEKSISYPTNYFASPIDIPITLVGNFGEPRTLHFHTGLDIRTNQEEGHKVFAAADGYISRINVSGSGYGNALYVTHPNGYTTVYGHLKVFNDRIMLRLRKEQYAKQSFSVDFNLSAGEIKVKKGEVIALSGNTGGSGGPHLHFEIRDSTEHPINPMLFGFNLKDNEQPLISSLKFYPEDELKYKSDGYRAAVTLKNGVYEVLNELVKVNDKKVGISVNTFDKINLTEARIGIYAMKMYDGKNLVYEYRMDKIAFSDKRSVLSHIDYPVFVSEGHKAFHKCFVEPGNKCPVYSNLNNRGIVDLSDDKPHDIKIEVSDFAGNTSAVHFKLQHDKASILFKEKAFSYTKRFDYDHENEFSNPEIKMKIPVGVLFDNVYFMYSVSAPTTPGIFSKVYQLDKQSTEVMDWFSISLKTEDLPAKFVDKAVVIHKDIPAGYSCYGGKFENGFITAKVREFGTYFVKIDTTLPHITALNVKPGKNMRLYQKLLFKVSDNLSGISDFDTYLDGQWVVTEYDAKTSSLTYNIDPKLIAGEHTFKVAVTDERKNTAEYSIKFRM